MGISASLILSAVGAILIWGVNATASGLNIHTIGAILLIIGIIGFVISLFFWSTWGGFGSASRTTVVRDREPVVREREIVDRY
jgi:beta-lactamase regulating signal transducer with metallopeptidase domain